MDQADHFRRFLTAKLQRKHVVPIKTGTQLSLYTGADEIISLRCAPQPQGGRHQSSKPGLRNKRHLSHRGTLIFLIRARCPSIAEDWFLGLYTALDRERLSSLEIHSPELGFRVRLPADAEAHDTASVTVSVSATRQLMTAGLPHANLASKEEMLASCKTLLASRVDWAELLRMVEREGLPLALAWRKGALLDWLLTEWSVDGVRRIWDVYVGAVMRQSSAPVHKLEVRQQYSSCSREMLKRTYRFTRKRMALIWWISVIRDTLLSRQVSRASLRALNSGTKHRQKSSTCQQLAGS